MKEQLFLLILIFQISCVKSNQDNCPVSKDILSQFVQPTGEEVIIDNNGNAFLLNSDGCELVLKYFDPGFRDEHYFERNGEVLIKSDDGNIPIVKSVNENFENYDSFLDLFYSSIEEIGPKVWGSMTLQSPSARTVEEYVALRKCIQNSTCEFLDNRIELVDDPINVGNQCLKFTSVEKAEDMVVCKSSIQSTLLFLRKQMIFGSQRTTILKRTFLSQLLILKTHILKIAQALE